MSSVVLVRCSGCFKRYPINPNKHKDREVRYCPFCKTPKKVRGRFSRFLPNPKWKEQKEIQAAERQHIKEMQKTTSRKPQAPPIAISAADLLALSLAVKEQFKQEQARKREIKSIKTS